MSEPAVLPKPPWASVIWRYMELVDFLSLLQTRGLWFSRLADLEDAFEAQIPKPNLQPTVEMIAEHWPHLAHAVGGPAVAAELLAEHVAWAKPRTAVNCWYVNDDESLAMWQAHGPSQGSVAISASASRVAEAIHHEGATIECFAGTIKYIDHDHDPVDVDHFLGVFFAKGRQFAFEQELRFIAHRDTLLSAGLLVAIDIDKLIDEVVVRTEGSPWILHTVAALIEIHGVQCKVRASNVVG